MTSAASYSDLVKEAFIDPIRSVMIIDDDYPTWEEILDSDRWVKDSAGNLTSPKKPKGWWRDSDGTKELIKQFRDRDQGLMIDIYDGSSPQTPDPDEIANFLHQSDLLVLDYQLEGEALGGEKAQQITHSLLTKNHFNLIVVHTKKDALFDPFAEILMRLLGKCPALLEKQADIDLGGEAIDDAEQEDLAERLVSSFTYEQYLATRHPVDGKKSIGFLIGGQAPFAETKSILVEAGLGTACFKHVLLWLCDNFEKQYAQAFGETEALGLNWSAKQGCLWIRTSRGFITFARKKHTADIIQCLRAALEDWRPSPSRLISAKYRYSLDEQGVIAEDATLSRKHVFSKFYDDISKAKTEKRGAILDDYVVRQSEQLTAKVQKAVREFGLTVVQIDEADGCDFLSHYGVDLSNASQRQKAVRHYNNYVSCIPVHGYHLTSGHIFNIDDEKWVVVSPACDMVPKQNPMGFGVVHEKHRPFIALRLYPAKNNLTDHQINSGSYLFLENNGKSEVYCTHQKPSEGLEQAPKMDWKNFIALNEGIFHNQNNLQIAVINATEEAISSTTLEINVTAQLRYEFALNLIQRVGATMTRVGLSYVGSGANS